MSTNQNKTLKSVVQINANITNGDDATTLYPRELYITKQGELVVGRIDAPSQEEPTEVKKISVNKALLSENTINTSLNTRLKKMNGYTIENSTVKYATVSDANISNGTTFAKTESGAGKITNKNNVLTIENATMKGSKLNLSNVCYGSAEDMNNITNPAAGDIFIVV